MRIQDVILLLVMCMQPLKVLHAQTSYNFGVNGNNSRQSEERFDREVLPVRPDICFIAFGMNDAVNDENAVPIADFEQNIEAMVLKCKAHNIVPVLLTIHPVVEQALYQRHANAVDSFYMGRGGANQIILAYNRVIRAVALRNKTEIIDWYKEVACSTKLKELVIRPDGVHLSDFGLYYLSRVVAGYLETHCNGASVIAVIGDSIVKQGWLQIAVDNMKARRGMFLTRGDVLLDNKEKIAFGDPVLSAALTTLQQEADNSGWSSERSGDNGVRRPRRAAGEPRLLERLSQP